MIIRRAWVRATVGVALAIAVLAAVAAAVLWGVLRASLPRTTGRIAVLGPTREVSIERDSLGIPVITGSSREDVAFATGFVHAQERFFQMDLMRRAAAGELAALFGPAAINSDREVRLHPFRWVAREVVQRATAREKAVLEAYRSGVNAGLADLGARPPEYLLLRQVPRPWRDDDTVLVVIAMFLQLQQEDSRGESSLGLVADLLPSALAAFLAPQGGEWDAPLDGGALPAASMPGPEVINLRGGPAGHAALEVSGGREGDLRPGSNNWAVAGRRTMHGAAIVANDMHLGIGLPPPWYRAELRWPEGGRMRHLAGVTLPGTPVVVVGSNGRIAWGFTNSYADFSDLIVLDEVAGGYRTPNGVCPFERRVERIDVAGRAVPELLEVDDTIWGPVIDRDHRGRRRAQRWTAHDPEALNLGLLEMEFAEDVSAALAVGNCAGIPGQNLVAGDADGVIGWTIAGRLPLRLGCDGRRPARWDDGGCRWDGLRASEQTPRLVAPAEGIIWTANNRVVSEPSLAVLGDGGYGLGARAGQIRDRLRLLDRSGERDSLALQLDDEARFLTRWHDLLLDTMNPTALAADGRRRDLRVLVAGWGGHAAVDSVGYRIVRAFRLKVFELALDPLLAPCRAADKKFSRGDLPQAESAVWQLVTRRPLHLLDSKFASWDELLLAAADDVRVEVAKSAGSLDRATWGERNTVRLRHPLSAAVPWLGRWLDDDSIQLPGDGNMPRVQGVGFGASERMVVAPGRESEGFFHMPGGQSGHPLSPHYRDMTRAWARGEPTPFSAGAPREVLYLVPASPAEAAQRGDANSAGPE